jgi:RNA polymerase sigma-70 factor (ECF subfamily)
MADPDAPLMLALQRGEEFAFATLVGRHRERVFRLACRYLGDENAAEDLAQEAFLRVYRARLSWKPRAKFSTWLYRVTANACLNEIRARRTRRAVETTAPAGPGGEPPPVGADPKAEPPAEVLVREETAARVREAVARLPGDQRLAVVLSKYEGLSYRELADAMERSVPAVKSLLVRARENLRKDLAALLDRAPPAADGDDDGDGPLCPTERRTRERRAAREAARPGGKR